ncbi:hypothetical protein [Sphaerisporangium corydalis]|uniref:Uncharacterized protein n=1 Tax=Sphaerisporangium corydalis TaxID=1441875 RepID=A0ABV9EIG8_9ACTN|nr:hypothetical protein [Sphaerisporangium corydalis]
MSIDAHDRRRPGIAGKLNGWRGRLPVFTALAALISGLGIVTTPGVAHATDFGPVITCPSDPNIVWRQFTIGRVPYYEGYRYTAVSAASTFNVSDARVVDNTLADTPITATFTSSQSRTFRIIITATVGTTAELTKSLQASVSTQIVQERTTAIGVNASLVVAPRTRVTGQYGIQAFDVVYNVQTVRAWPAIPNGFTRCWDQGSQQGTTNAPTLTEGWRFIEG